MKLSINRTLSLDRIVCIGCTPEPWRTKSVTISETRSKYNRHLSHPISSLVAPTGHRPSFSEPSNTLAHAGAAAERREGLLIDLEPFLTECNDLFGEGRRDNHHTIGITEQDITRMDPEIAVELQRHVYLRRSSECVGTQDGCVTGKHLAAAAAQYGGWNNWMGKWLQYIPGIPFRDVPRYLESGHQ